ncbi:MAG: OprO/OprP family phosphate-selective porin [Candidatus Pacebacteria bacterium]|nr:OprO/OprP family phosphate-selective porin [Candidatus Paceibacterota bacterium]
MKRILWIAAGVVFVTSIGLRAGGVTYTVPDSDDYVTLAGRAQVQYHMSNPSEGETTDELLLRRLRATLIGSTHPDWLVKMQVDFGKNNTSLVDAYVEYTGLEAMNVAIGNYNTPFSRESIASSKKQQLVERTFVGDHNYGVTDRQLGLHLYGAVADEKVAWALAATKAAVDPNNSRIDFDTVASLDKGDDWNEGEMACARLEFFPLGSFSYDQGDFTRKPRVAVGIAGYAWQNDDDNLEPMRSNDVDTVIGTEISAAVRGYGCSVDMQYNRIESDLVDEGINDGLYKDSDTTLETWAIEGGYMILAQKLEAVAGYEEQDADGFEEIWTRTSVGLNYFIEKQDIKVQVTYRMGENVDGEPGNDLDELFVQFQYVF